MRFANLLLLLCVLIVKSASAQKLDKKYYLIDSLERSKITDSDFEILSEQLKKYHTSSTDTSKLFAISFIVENTYDEKLWIRYNALMLEIAKSKQKTSTGYENNVYRSLEALALNNIGYYYFNYTSKMDSALVYYEKGLKINEEIEKSDAMIVSYSNIANVYQNQGNLLKAIQLYNKALSFENRISDKTKILAPMNNLANVYLYLGDTAKSLINLKKCFAIVNRSNDKGMKAHLLHNIGLLTQGRDYSSAIQSVKKALALRKEIGDKKGTAQSLMALAGLSSRKGSFVLAEEYLKECLPLVEEINNPIVKGLYLNQLSILNQSKGDKKTAIKYILQGINVLKNANSINELQEMTSNAIVMMDGDKSFNDKKLEMYELLSNLNKIQNKTAVQKAALKEQYENQIKVQEAEFRADQAVKDERNRSEKRKQKYIIIAISIFLASALLFSFFIYRALKENKEKNLIIQYQKKETEKQKSIIEDKQKEIIDSINYAKRIQNSFLPSEKEFKEGFPDSFVIYKPKDIVSGDFYWMIDSSNYTTVQKNFRSVAVADCTGHGVPGAILSMLGSSILNQAILDKTVMSTADLLDFLNSELKKNLRSKSDEIIRDGMDISCCIIFNDSLKMQFSGANNPCWILRNGQIIELKADKQSVTAHSDINSSPFKLTEFQLLKNDIIYLFTDGIPDQFGGPKGKKFKYSQLEKLLLENAHLTMEEQKNVILKTINSWKGDLEQTDDNCIIGIRI